MSYKGENLGQGSFTRNFKGYKSNMRDGEDKGTKVFLKELDVAHRNWWEVRFLKLKCVKNVNLMYASAVPRLRASPMLTLISG